MQDVIASAEYRDLATPRVALGEPAFDFELPVFDASSGVVAATGGRFRLSAHRGREPVALIFGSYT